MHNFRHHNPAGGRLGKFGFDKFIKLAHNSYKANRYSLTVDNCRLAANMALKEGNKNNAAKAYELWIKALFKDRKFAEIKKICCEARSKFGNNLDLLYYEFKAAREAGDNTIALKLGREFIELHKNCGRNSSSLFNKSVAKLDEVKTAMIELEKNSSSQPVESGQE
jgi:hypothetical protein